MGASRVSKGFYFVQFELDACRPSTWGLGLGFRVLV